MNIFTAVKYCCILHGRVCVMHEEESDGAISFLDILITRKPGGTIKLVVYRNKSFLLKGRSAHGGNCVIRSAHGGNCVIYSGKIYMYCIIED